MKKPVRSMELPDREHEPDEPDRRVEPAARLPRALAQMADRADRRRRAVARRAAGLRIRRA
ncbi:hypothetical protein BCEP4_1850003 [Burkholderia cepacia]|nr:hypothetical protein BCEP4_1850003 [Burkholderia cepacia]